MPVKELKNEGLKLNAIPLLYTSVYSYIFIQCQNEFYSKIYFAPDIQHARQKFFFFK